MKNCIAISDLFTYENGKLYWKIKRKGTNGIGSRAGYEKPNGYRAVTVNKKKQYEHRVVWELFYGAVPSDKQIDHANRDKSDNNIENLRLVTARGNAANRVDNSEFVGVINRGGGYYEAHIWAEGQSIYGGRHRSFGDALAARLLLEEEYL